MTCRTAWAGEQLHDFEAGSPFNAGASLRLPQSRSRAGCPCLGEVPQPTEVHRRQVLVRAAVYEGVFDDPKTPDVCLLGARQCEVQLR